MEILRRRIKELFGEGRVEHLSSGELEALGKEEAELKVRKAEETKPGTFPVASSELRKRIESEVMAGRLPFLEARDVEFLTQAKAENLVWIADVAGRRPIREKQLERLRSFMSRGYTGKKSEKELGELSDSEAQKLLEEAETRFHERIVIDARNGREVQIG